MTADAAAARLALASAAAHDAEDWFEHAPCGFLATLPDGRLLTVNQTFLDWTGARRDEILDLRFQQLLSKPGQIFHETHYAPLMRMQGFVNEIAFEILDTQGKRLPVLVSSVRKDDATGVPLLHRITVFRASERRQYERELLHARRQADSAATAKAELLSMISHDVRTPLTSIMIAMQMLEEADLHPAARRYLRVIKSSADGLLLLTRQVLEASRIESAPLTLETRSFDMRSLVVRLLAELATQAEDKSLALLDEIDPELPAQLLGDPVKIGQILGNLLFNAIKFTASGTVRLSLAVTARGEGAIDLRISVSDTGIGIEADRLNAIFGDYTQADYDIGLRFGGAGLGLGICRRLLDLHGSTMEVDSEPGRGSRFAFTLRLAEG